MACAAALGRGAYGDFAYIEAGIAQPSGEGGMRPRRPDGEHAARPQRPADGFQSPEVVERATPPVINTFPFLRSVALNPFRAISRLPAAVKLPVEGSYNSALDGKVDPGQVPPVIRTLPSGRRVVVCPVRAVNNSPVGVKVPVCCAKAKWQNDRARTTNCNAADLLDISFLHPARPWTCMRGPDVDSI